MGGGRWEVGGGRWEVGGGRWEVVLLILILLLCCFFCCCLSLVSLYYRYITELTNSKISGSSAEKRV